MDDFIDSRESLKSKKNSSLTERQSKCGDITGRVPVVISSTPKTIAYVTKNTPEVVQELKRKYAYLNLNPYENIKEHLKGQVADRFQGKEQRKQKTPVHDESGDA